MQRSPILIATMLLFAGACAPAPQVVAGPALGAEAEVQRVVADFHAALAAGDSLRVLNVLHPAALIYEAGGAETVEQYRAGHLAADIAFARAVAQQREPQDVLIRGDMAVALARYTARGEFRDRQIDSRGVETMVLLRTAEGWRIRHVHWSSR